MDQMMITKAYISVRIMILSCIGFYYLSPTPSLVTSFMMPSTSKLVHSYHHHEVVAVSVDNNRHHQERRCIHEILHSDTSNILRMNKQKLLLHARKRKYYDFDLDDAYSYDDDNDDANYKEDKYYTEEDDYDEEDYDFYDDDDDEYYEEEDDDDYDNEEGEELPLDWEWETYQRNTFIYLPPPLLPPLSKVQKQTQKETKTEEEEQQYPKTIIHFIGGTLFGSYPLQFYKQFLQEIAHKSNSIIVATSIPVSFQSNPLNHYRLCRNIVKDFRGAYRNVICDEYGMDVVKEMKIVGLGHSLGSRLHCVINTDDIDDDDDQIEDYSYDNENNSVEKGRRKRSSKLKKKALQNIAMKREGNILIAFNNYSAISSVPGVRTLEKRVRDTRKEERDMKARIQEQKRRRKTRNRSRRTKDYGDNIEYDDDYDVYDDDYYYLDRGSKRKKTKQRNRYYDNIDDDDDDDFDMFFDDDDLEFQDILTSIKSSLTPDIQKSSLEFQPSPDELWDKMTKSYGKNVAKTLIVQFDNDRIDQSSRLAQEILDCTSTTSSSKDNAVDDKNDSSDVPNKAERETVIEKEVMKNIDEDRLFFARLKGTHLNPVTFTDSFGLMKLWQRLSVDELLKEAIDEENAFERRTKRKDKRTSLKKSNLQDLTDSIAQYIVEIIN